MCEMEEKFASLLILAHERLKTVAPIDDIHLYLNQLSVGQKENVPMFDEHMAEIITHSTLKAVFMFLSRIGVWDFLNHRLLAHIAKKYPDKVLEAAVLTYSKDVDTFKERTKLEDFLRIWPGRTRYDSDPQRVPLASKLNAQWKEYTLADLANHEGYLASEFLLNQFIFHFSNAEPGCVTLMWLIPASAAALIKKSIMKRQPDLKKMNIQELTVGDFIYKVGLAKG